ncbi:MAG TPA: TetR/AcrR family transcriptional regulator [Actinomycetes bacterium]|nr:TetR/AcrR family transcriptional regulator [Actinomycetes bacterium]
MGQASPVSRRERVRASTLAEIKSCALELMRERGTTQVHFSDIARAMGMSAPALYRYFADRDDLLTALIRDAFNDLADTVAKAVAPIDPDDDWARLRAGMQAYRAWALAQPERFALIFGLPIPGFAVDEESGTTEAAKGAMDVLMSLVEAAYDAGRLAPSAITHLVPQMEEIMAEERPEGRPELPLASCQGTLHAWMTMHGFVSLESGCHLAMWPEEARDRLFEAQTELAARAIGITVPAP